jgi:hypothetical protein
MLTQEKHLKEEQVVAFLSSFTSAAESQDSLSAPLVAAVAWMQQRMMDMSSAISSGNDDCLKNIRQASFGRNGSGVPTTSTAQTLLASACNLVSEGQKAFTDCQNTLMGAVSSSVQRAAQQNFVVAKLSAMRTNNLQTENAELKKLVLGLSGEVGELRDTVSKMRDELDAIELRFGRERHSVPTVPEEWVRGRGVQRPSSPSASASRLRSASRASSCDSASSTLTQISRARGEARSRRPSMGPAVQFDPPDGAVAEAASVLPTVFVPFQPPLHQVQPQQLQLLPQHAGPTFLQLQQEFQQMPVAWPRCPLPLQMFQQEVQQMPGSLQIPVVHPSMAPEEWPGGMPWSATGH